ncbi:toxin-activating lysine-acyltransferase [Leptothrix sp. BB-4]
MQQNLQDTNPPAAPFTALGQIAWLWMHSPLHERWTVDLQRHFILPPVMLGQYELLERDGVPVAYASWAWVSHEVEVAYIGDPGRLPPGAWRSGERLWFVDWVAPFGKRDSLALRTRLALRFHDQVARAIRVKTDRKTARVMEFVGPDRRPDGVGSRQLDQYHRQTIEALRQRHPSRQL